MILLHSEIAAFVSSQNSPSGSSSQALSLSVYPPHNPQIAKALWMSLTSSTTLSIMGSDSRVSMLTSFFVVDDDSRFVSLCAS